MSSTADKTQAVVLPPPDRATLAGDASDSRQAGIEFYGGYQVYSESGVDLTLLRENLKRPVEQRLNDNLRSVAFVREIQESVWAADRILKDRPRWNMLDAAGILRRLLDGKVEFVVIGGLAMVIHGSAHVTKDLDLCYRRTRGNIESLVRALSAIHPYLRGAPPGLPFKLDADTVAAGLNFTLTTDSGDLDLLGEVAGVGWFEQALAVSEQRVMFGLAIHVLSLDGLIAAKRAAGRPVDQRHLLELEELKKLREAAP